MSVLRFFSAKKCTCFICQQQYLWSNFYHKKRFLFYNIHNLIFRYFFSDKKSNVFNSPCFCCECKQYTILYITIHPGPLSLLGFISQGGGGIPGFHFQEGGIPGFHFPEGWVLGFCFRGGTNSGFLMSRIVGILLGALQTEIIFRSLRNFWTIHSKIQKCTYAYGPRSWRIIFLSVKNSVFLFQYVFHDVF